MIKSNNIFKCLIIALFLSLSISLFAQNSLVERYLSAANKEYSSKNYSKAYNYINYVLGEYNSNSLPQNVEILAESVYYSYLSALKDSSDYAKFKEVKDKLLEFPTLSSDRINRLVKTINTLEAQDIVNNNDSSTNNASASAIPNAASVAISNTAIEEAREARQTASAATAAAAAAAKANQATSELLAKQQEAAEKEKAALQAQIEAEKIAREAALEKEYQRQQQLIEAQNKQYEVLSKTTDQTSMNTLIIIIAAGCILFIVIVIVIIVVSINMRNSKKQQEQFEATLKVVSEMARAPSNRMLVNGLPDIYDTPLRSAGSSRLVNSLPEPELTEEERQEVKDLATKCEKLGTEIDRVTGRKNNSKNVSEMVFKICHEMGISSNTSMLFFCASMVYDAGFLLVEPSLLAAESLTDEQKEEIRCHVHKGVEKIGFVPERYHGIFEDAVLKHHENMDGSGYPEGLSGEQIPLIGRLIHVVETFISLISRRSYRNIFDKESAIAELRKHPEQYDQSIVNCLDSLV